MMATIVKTNTPMYSGKGTVGQVPPQGPVGQTNGIDNTISGTWRSGMGGGFQP